MEGSGLSLAVKFTASAEKLLDANEKEEEEDDDGELEEVESSEHLQRLKKLFEDDPKNPFNELDERRKMIFDQYKKKIKSAPKTLMQKAEEKKDQIERQLEVSDKKLSELLAFGDELVTNIKVANEKRELTRRQFEEQHNAILQTDLKKESMESIARFENITARWSELDVYKEPMALFEQLEKQKENIAQLMASKDSIIDQCQEEINRVNAKYYADQEKQANDVRCLIERIDNQIELIKIAYKSHMNMLETTIEDERQSIALTAATKWNKFYDTMLDNEKRKFEIAAEKEKFYAAEIERISANQEEITRSTRIRLEKDAELLEWELRNVKNTVLMNSEKLDYNYQVLQKRNEENVIINNQQKRRVAKLTEGISAMRAKINASAIHAESTLRKYSADIQKLHSSISELENKSQQFRLINLKKFNLVWEINFKEIKELLTRVLEIDKILYEQQLAIPWNSPDLDLTDINARDVKQKDVRDQTSDDAQRKKKQETAVANEKERQLEIGLVRNVLRKIADRAGFLVEEKLLKILEPYTEEEKCLVRIDNVFAALRISDISIVSSLTSCFKPYSWCPNCSTNFPPEIMESFYKIRTSSRNTASEPIKFNKNAEETCSNHFLVIEPAFVLMALNEFTKLKSLKKRTPYTELDAKTINLIPFDTKIIKSFWSKFGTYMPKEKEKLWTAMEHGLNHYVVVLKQRAQLDTECTFLRKQNQELKHLLQKFKV